MWGPKAKINTCISDTDEIYDAFIISHQDFEMTP